MNILVTGATGFVGSLIIPELLDQGHHLWALHRGKKPKGKPHKNLKWIVGDLKKPEELPELESLDAAYYLVHGLKENPKTFEYDEAMAATTFLKWIKGKAAKLIYLGGLGPRDAELSPHLRSRHLTGAILGASGIPTIEFRASIILGDGSASFEMVKALSERFPIRPEMNLLDVPCQPLAAQDLESYLVRALDLNVSGHEIIEVGGPDVTTYGRLLDLYSELAGLSRKKVKVPEVDKKVLIKALDYAIPEHADVAKKLTESLEHATVVTDTSAKEHFPEIKPQKVRVAMDLARSKSQTEYAPVWNKDFLKHLLSDKILTQSGLFSPELLKNLERVGKLRSVLARKK